MIAATVTAAIAPPLQTATAPAPPSVTPFPTLVDPLAVMPPRAQGEIPQPASLSDAPGIGTTIDPIIGAAPEAQPRLAAAEPPLEPSAGAAPAVELPITVDAMVTAMMAALATAPAASATAPFVVEQPAVPAATQAPAIAPAPPAAVPVEIIRAPAIAKFAEQTRRDDPTTDRLAGAGDPFPLTAGAETSPPLALAPLTQSPLITPSMRSEAPVVPPPRELALDSDGEWLATIARDIARAADPSAPLVFRLRPEALGELRIEMTRIDDSTSIRIVTESEAARAALADGQQRLVAEARNNGVRLAEPSVTLADSGSSQHHQDRRQNEPNRPMIAGPPPIRSNAPDLANHDPSQPRDRYA